MIRRAWDSIIQKYFSGSIFAFFGVIDIAERPEVYYPCVHVVKLGDSSVGAGIRGVTEKGNTYPKKGV